MSLPEGSPYMPLEDALWDACEALNGLAVSLDPGRAIAEAIAAANDACWTVVLMMGLGMLPVEDPQARRMLAAPMERWIAVARPLQQGVAA